MVVKVMIMKQLQNCFAKFNPKISTWTSLEGKFSAVDHYIDRCRRSFNTLNLEAKTSYNNLSQAEKKHLKTLGNGTISSSNLPTKVVQLKR